MKLKSILLLTLIFSSFSIFGQEKDLLISCKVDKSLSYKVVGTEQAATLSQIENGKLTSTTELTSGDNFGKTSNVNDELSLYVLEKVNIDPKTVTFARIVRLDGENVQLVSYHNKDGKQLTAAIFVTMAMPIICR